MVYQWSAISGPHFWAWISLRQLASLDQILCVASLGWGKGCIRFLRRLDQNSGFNGNRKCPLTYNGENEVSTFSLLFLAHRSRRLTRWAYSIARLRCLFVVVHTFEQKCLQDQLTNFSQILSVASLGWGKGCFKFWGRSDQNCGYHGNRKLPLTYNGKNAVFVFSQSPVIGSFSNWQVTNTGIKFQMSSNLGWVRLFTTEVFALERSLDFEWGKCLQTYNGENVVWRIAPSFLIGSLSNFQVRKTVLKSQMSWILGHFGPLVLELLALERQKFYNCKNVVNTIVPSFYLYHHQTCS